MAISTQTADRSEMGLVVVLVSAVKKALSIMERLPASVGAFIARFSIAAVFWKSGQTKIEGFSIDIIEGRFDLGWPALSETAVFLFEEEYALPFVSAEFAAPLAALAEHVLPLFILIGFATRFSALGLLIMTLVIQIFVYPSDYATHGVWAAALLCLMSHGAGKFSVDHLFARRYVDKETT